MDEIEHIKTWVATMKLDDDTAVELVHNGFTSMESISLLTLCAGLLLFAYICIEDPIKRGGVTDLTPPHFCVCPKP